MTEATFDYRAMWQSLGLDLDAHDALLSAIPVMYQDAYLSQENRPEGMAYFDFVMSEIHGLRIKELLDHKAAGGSVIGTFCLYVPEEIIRALGGVAVGLCAGAEWAYDKVEGLLPANTCALIKSFMGFKLGNVCPYVESADQEVNDKRRAYNASTPPGAPHPRRFPVRTPSWPRRSPSTTTSGASRRWSTGSPRSWNTGWRPGRVWPRRRPLVSWSQAAP